MTANANRPNFCEAPCVTCPVWEASPKVSDVIAGALPLAMKRSVSFEEVKSAVDIRLVEVGKPPVDTFDLHLNAGITRATMNIARGLCPTYSHKVKENNNGKDF